MSPLSMLRPVSRYLATLCPASGVVFSQRGVLRLLFRHKDTKQNTAFSHQSDLLYVFIVAPPPPNAL